MGKKRGWIGRSIWEDYIIFMIFLGGFFLIFGGALLSSENFKVMAIVWLGTGVVFGIGAFMEVNKQNKNADEAEMESLKYENEDLKKKLKRKKKNS